MSSEILRDVDPSAVETIRGKYGEMPAIEYGAMYASRRNEVDKRIAELEEAETDEDFVTLSAGAILESARMNSFRGNYEDVHVVATIAHRISQRRVKDSGKNPECSVHSLYHQGWIEAYTSQGHEYDRDDVCSCDAE